MPSLNRYVWKQRLRPVTRLIALVLVIEGGLRAAEAYTASPLPRLLSMLSSSDDTTKVNLGKPGRATKVRYGDYDPYAGNRSKQEREESVDAPPEDGDALPLPVAVDNLPPPNLPKSERRCLAEAVYFEGKQETIEGQIAVAQIVLNRVRSGKYPTTICAVVRQGRGGDCQFPAVCKAAGKPPENDEHWQKAAWIADDTAAGRAWLSELTDATHYHNASAKPVWRLSMHMIRKVGWRLYYSDPALEGKLPKLKPGQPPLEVAADKIAAADAMIDKQDAAATAEAAADAKRKQRERLAEQRERMNKHGAESSVKVKTSAIASQRSGFGGSNAAEAFSNMSR
jgi:spore germination cell wall hydrolase CwlJ-like protein